MRRYWVGSCLRGKLEMARLRGGHDVNKIAEKEGEIASLPSLASRRVHRT